MTTEKTLRAQVAQLQGQLEAVLRARRYALHALEVLLEYVDNEDGSWDFAVGAYEALDTVVPKQAETETGEVRE